MAVDFGARPARAALARLVLADGAPLPAGAEVRLDGRNDSFVSAPGGDVSFTELNETNKGAATWEGGQCRFRFAFPPTSDPQPRLADVKCEAAGT